MGKERPRTMKGIKVTVHPASGFGVTSAPARRTCSTSCGRNPDLCSSARSWFLTVDLSHPSGFLGADGAALAAVDAAAEVAGLFFAMGAEKCFLSQVRNGATAFRGDGGCAREGRWGIVKVK